MQYNEIIFFSILQLVKVNKSYIHQQFSTIVLNEETQIPIKPEFQSQLLETRNNIDSLIKTSQKIILREDQMTSSSNQQKNPFDDYFKRKLTQTSQLKESNTINYSSLSTEQISNPQKISTDIQDPTNMNQSPSQEKNQFILNNIKNYFSLNPVGKLTKQSSFSFSDQFSTNTKKFLDRENRNFDFKLLNDDQLKNVQNAKQIYQVPLQPEFEDLPLNIEDIQSLNETNYVTNSQSSNLLKEHYKEYTHDFNFMFSDKKQNVYFERQISTISRDIIISSSKIQQENSLLDQSKEINQMDILLFQEVEFNVNNMDFDSLMNIFSERISDQMLNNILEKKSKQIQPSDIKPPPLNIVEEPQEIKFENQIHRLNSEPDEELEQELTNKFLEISHNISEKACGNSEIVQDFRDCELQTSLNQIIEEIQQQSPLNWLFKFIEQLQNQKQVFSYDPVMVENINEQINLRLIEIVTFVIDGQGIYGDNFKDCLSKLFQNIKSIKNKSIHGYDKMELLRYFLSEYQELKSESGNFNQKNVIQKFHKFFQLDETYQKILNLTDREEQQSNSNFESQKYFTQSSHSSREFQSNRSLPEKEEPLFAEHPMHNFNQNKNQEIKEPHYMKQTTCLSIRMNEIQSTNKQAFDSQPKSTSNSNQKQITIDLGDFQQDPWIGPSENNQNSNDWIKLQQYQSIKSNYNQIHLNYENNT